MINFDFSTSLEPKPGSLLISEPFMHDSYFTRSVILLCDHNDEGSFGFVLNKYIETSSKDILPEISENEIKISIGGPVDNSNLFYIHNLGDKIENAIPVHSDLFIGGDFNQLKDLVNNDPSLLKRVRFFIGYSGWSPDQLKEEMKEKSWVVVDDIDAETILDTSDEALWQSLMKKLGGKFKLMSTFPVNPSDN